MSKEVEFNTTVIEAASGDLHISKLVEGLIAFPELIDTPDPNDAAKRTPMHFAASKGNTLAIETLVRFGSKAIDAPDNVGCTPLHFSAWFGHAHAIEALIRLGSRAIDTPNTCGLTPLWYSARYGSHCTQVLRALGAGTTFPLEGLPISGKERLAEKIEEDEAVRVRYRVYFEVRLAQRLLFELESPAPKRSEPRNQRRSIS